MKHVSRINGFKLRIAEANEIEDQLNVNMSAIIYQGRYDSEIKSKFVYAVIGQIKLKLFISDSKVHRVPTLLSIY